MTEGILDLARPSGALPRAIGAVTALLALVMAACSKSTPTVNASPSPVPTVTIPGAPTPTAVPNTSGIAYLPDAGNGGIFQGVQVVHFEDINGNLLGGPQGLNIRFAGAVGAIGFTVDSSDAIAAISLTGGPPYNLAQDVFGASVGSIVPVGAPYVMSSFPPTAPPTTGASPAPTPTPIVPPVVPDAYTLALLGTGTVGLALTTGVGSQGVLGITSLVNAPPQYGGFIPFVGGAISPPSYPRTNIVVAPNGTYALVRGPIDMLVLSIIDIPTGFELQVLQYSSSLGYGSGPTLRGDGAMAISAEDPGRALIGQTPGVNGLTVITGLPKTIVTTDSITLPSRPHSIAISPGGAFAAVGADAGFYIIGGVGSGALTIQPPFAPSSTSGNANSPPYVACDGTTRHLQNVTSVAFDSTAKFLILFGTSPGLSCPMGYNSTVMVLPFNQSTGSTPSPAPVTSPGPTPPPGSTSSPTPSPVPTKFVENGIITQPSDNSLMVVR